MSGTKTNESKGGDSKVGKATKASKSRGFVSGKIAVFIVLLACWSSFFRSQVETACPAEFETLPQLLHTGVIIMRNVSTQSEMEDMVKFVDNVSLPLRYGCGASIYNPDECKKPRELLQGEFPVTMSVEEKFKQWAKKRKGGNRLASLAGLCEEELCDEDEQLRLFGSTFLKVNAMKFPFSLLAGPWDRWMGFIGKDKWIHHLRYWLTMKFNIPFYLGYHRWHVDGDGIVYSRPGRYHKLFMMVDKDNGAYRENPEGTRMSSNIMIMPRNWRKQQLKKYAPLRKQLKRVPILLQIFDLLMHDIGGCVAQLNPGDALFFREDQMHRTQNVDHDRVAVIFDVWMETKQLKSLGYSKQKELWQERCTNPLLASRIRGSECEKFECHTHEPSRGQCDEPAVHGESDWDKEHSYAGHELKSESKSVQ